MDKICAEIYFEHMASIDQVLLQPGVRSACLWLVVDGEHHLVTSRILQCLRDRDGICRKFAVILLQSI